MAEFTKKTGENGREYYRNVTDNVTVSKSSLSDELIARLAAVPEGTPVAESADIDESVNEMAEDTNKSDASRTVHLKHPLLINGKVYRADKDIVVPNDVADDLERMDEEYSEYETNLLRSQHKARQASQIKPSDVN